ncbi:MAG: UDP-N-acetylmuramate--L-alanine ligase [Bacteroidales bacterium]|jgi:UDP-N-acetylmuramate--alanine ligase|nr:UDP-N-acetylmuramate--L-alanine ligase [Bacteroidales bacterium]
MVIEKIKSVYFIGIGGIGMSALARYFVLRGIRVSGYDKTPTTLTDQLIREGIPIHFEENINLIPEKPDLVIYTPAIPLDNAEFLYYKGKELPLKKRAEVLGMISAPHKTIAVAGTHGKTTISTLIAHILHCANVDFLAFLGGISKNYGTNFLTNSPPYHLTTSLSHQPATFCVVEADEYDRSFLQLAPFIAIITSADPDHLDIYSHPGNLKKTFEEFTSHIATGGSLIMKQGVGLTSIQKNTYSNYSYSLHNEAGFYAKKVRVEQDLFHFDLVMPDGIIENIVLGVPGWFNLENAVAALAAGHLLGIDEAYLKDALRSYRGVQRRFDFRIRNDNLVYIDDYAHHPEELRACISAVRAMYPGKKITGVFQPHLFSRTRDLATGFARSLELLDELLLLDIYPAREKPIKGVDSRMLLDLVQLKIKKIVTKNEVVSLLEKNKPEILLTLGAGDIDQLVNPITNALSNI